MAQRAAEDGHESGCLAQFYAGQHSRAACEAAFAEAIDRLKRDEELFVPDELPKNDVPAADCGHPEDPRQW